MQTNPVILFAGGSTWHLGSIGADGPALTTIAVGETSNADRTDTAAATAAIIAGAMRHDGYAGTPVVLAIPSEWCLCAPIATAGLPAKRRRRAMLFRLEEKLPFAAEEITADFLDDGPDAGEETLGVCVQTSAIAAVVEQLETQGIVVKAVCPTGLLALQELLAAPEAANAGPQDVVLWQSANGESLELFILRAGRPVGWFVLPNNPKDVLLHLAVAFPPGAVAERASRAIAVGAMGQNVEAALASRPMFRLTRLPDSAAPLAAATALAAAIVTDKSVPWINLRRDELAEPDPLRQVRVPLAYAMAAVMLFLLCATGGMLWRAGRYDQVRRHDVDAQETVFRQAFPAGPLPADVHSRLAAEERNLRGLSGADNPSVAPAPRSSGLLALRALMVHLPADDALRYRLLEIRLDQERFTLEGEARAHGDADLIAAALRRGGAFVVEPPRSEQMAAAAGASASAAEQASVNNAGVTFSITGTVAASAAPPARKGVR